MRTQKQLPVGKVKLNFPITAQGLIKLDKELVEKMDTRVVKRQELAGIESASSWETMNDDSRMLKDEIGVIGSQIDYLKIIRSVVIIIDDMDRDPETVGIGRIVTLANSLGEVYSYTILGPREYVPGGQIISADCPIAKELEGKKVGDSISFNETMIKIIAIKIWQPSLPS